MVATCEGSLGEQAQEFPGVIKVCDGVCAPCVSAMLFSFPSLGASAVVGNAYHLAGISGYGLQRSFSGCCSSLRIEFLRDAVPAVILVRWLRDAFADRAMLFSLPSERRWS